MIMVFAALCLMLPYALCAKHYATLDDLHYALCSIPLALWRQASNLTPQASSLMCP
jgi:hypothetical protein